MTDARVSQVPIEVLRTDLNVSAQVSQLPVEVLRTNLTPTAQISQIAVEVIRPIVPYVLTSSAGIFALTGQASLLRRGGRVAASAGASILTGQTAGSLRAYIFSVSSGAFLLSGQDASYKRPSMLICDPGAIVLTGQSSRLRQARLVHSATGAFAIVGKDAASQAVYTPVIEDTAAITSTISLLYQILISDPFYAREAAKAAMHVSLTQSLNSADAATYTFRPGAIIADVVAWTDAQPRTWKLVRSIVESTNFRDALVAAFPITVADTLTISGVATVVRAALVLEQLRLIDTAIARGTFHAQLVDSLITIDTLRRFFGGDVIDTFGVSGAAVYTAIFHRSLSDSASVADSLTPKLVIRFAVSDAVAVADTPLSKSVFNQLLVDGTEIGIGYIAPDGGFTTWAVNTRTGAVTEYENFEFNSFAQYGHKYLGASSDGLYELDGNTDDGDNIIPHIRSGYAQFSESKYSSFKAAYLGMRGSGDIILKLDTGDGKTYTYQTVVQNMQSTKVRLGKGLRARYFAFELIGTGPDFDLDTVEFIPLTAQRRV